MVKKHVSFYVELVLMMMFVAVFSMGAQAKTVLKYWTNYGPDINTINAQLIKEFQAKHPDVQIEWDSIVHEEMGAKLFTSFAAGEAPDAYWILDPDFTSFLEKGMLAPVDLEAVGVSSQEELEAQFIPGALAGFKDIDGVLYTSGLYDYTTFSLFYNPRLFGEVGLPVPSKTEPMSIREFVEAGKKLIKFDEQGKKQRDAFGYFFGSNMWCVFLYEPWIRQLGGELVDPETGKPLFDSEPVVEISQFMQDLVFKHRIMDPSFQLIDFEIDFVNERLAMFLGGPFMINVVEGLKAGFPLAITPLPVFEDGPRVTTLYTWGWVVNPRSDKTKLAWEFVTYMGSKPEIWWELAGTTVPRPWYMPTIIEQQPLYEAFVSDFNYAKPEFKSSHYQELSTLLLRTFTTVISDPKVDVRKLMTEAQSEALNVVK